MPSNISLKDVMENDASGNKGQWEEVSLGFGAKRRLTFLFTCLDSVL